MEFNYVILQAYAFINYLKIMIVFYKLEDPTNGETSLMEPINRRIFKKSLWINFTINHLTSGAKMGKSEKGAIWLNEDLLSPLIVGNFEKHR